MRKHKDQHIVGTPERPRGQQTGFAGKSDQNRKEVKETAPVRGRLKTENKMFGDVSNQNVSSDATTPSTNSPSTPAMKSNPKRAGGGAGGFKKRLAKARADR